MLQLWKEGPLGKRLLVPKETQETGPRLQVQESGEPDRERRNCRRPKKRLGLGAVSPVKVVDCIHTILPVNQLNQPLDDKIFLQANIVDEQGENQKILILPDSGNRARCLIQFDVFRKLFPQTKLYPIKEQISTAKRNEYLEIVGQPLDPIQFKFENKISYLTRPLVAKRLQLPCLFSHYDLQQLKMKVSYETGQVLLGSKMAKTSQVPFAEIDNSVSEVNLMNLIYLKIKDDILSRRCT